MVLKGQLDTEAFEALPLLPLPEYTLFPHTLVPFHIFEPRYLKMLDACLAGRRLLVVAGLKPGWEGRHQDDAATYAKANSLASVKALVMAGFGVGALLGFMLDPSERRALVKARVPHDPDCALYVGTSPHWSGSMEMSIETTLVQILTGLFVG